MSNNKESKENNYSHLSLMKAEYYSLNKEEKKRYMDLLTEWYMREKDILKIDTTKTIQLGKYTHIYHQTVYIQKGG